MNHVFPDLVSEINNGRRSMEICNKQYEEMKDDFELTRATFPAALDEEYVIPGQI